MQSLRWIVDHSMDYPAEGEEKTHRVRVTFGRALRAERVIGERDLGAGMARGMRDLSTSSPAAEDQLFTAPSIESASVASTWRNRESAATPGENGGHGKQRRESISLSARHETRRRAESHRCSTRLVSPLGLEPRTR